MVFFWVDNFIFYASDTQPVDDVIISLKDECLLDREKDIADFLGLQIEREGNTEKITLTQIGLVERLLEVMGM